MALYLCEKCRTRHLDESEVAITPIVFQIGAAQCPVRARPVRLKVADIGWAIKPLLKRQNKAMTGNRFFYLKNI